MKKYYIERKGLIKNLLTIEKSELNDYFYKTYKYFDNKGYFEVAEKGVWNTDRYTHDSTLVYPPTLAPTPDIFFATHLQDNQVWPLYMNYESLSEEILFSVIEILYEHISVYDYIKEEFNEEGPKIEFAEHINNILKMYKTGYYLEPRNGFIMQLPNEAIKEQLNYSGDEIPDKVYEQLSTATEMYYRFDSNMEMKKKAINILADILENERETLKDLLNENYAVSKNEHDKLIFGIVNAFNIRHNNEKQFNNYNKAIWYDWMMQYYTSVIITYYKLKQEKEKELLF